MYLVMSLYCASKVSGGINIDLFQEKYTSKISCYYVNPKDKDFCQKVLDFFFLNKASIHEEDFEFVRARNAKVYRVNYRDEECYLKIYAHKKISKKLQNNLQRRPEGIRNTKIAMGLLESLV